MALGGVRLDAFDTSCLQLLQHRGQPSPCQPTAPCSTGRFHVVAEGLAVGHAYRERQPRVAKRAQCSALEVDDRPGGVPCDNSDVRRLQGRSVLTAFASCACKPVQIAPFERADGDVLGRIIGVGRQGGVCSQPTREDHPST